MNGKLLFDLFGKLSDLLARQNASGKAPFDVPSNINANRSQEEIKIPRFGGPFQPGRPSNQPPPDEPGMYRINRDKIGVTNNLRRRKAEHERKGRIVPGVDDFWWQQAKPGVSAEELYRHEQKKITKHNPPLNVNGGGGGRRWEPR
jgi:hypothetical protein